MTSPFALAAAEPATSTASLPSIRTASGAEDRAAPSAAPADGLAPPALSDAPRSLPAAEAEPAAPLTPPHSPPKAVYKPGDDDDTARTASVQAPASGGSSEAASSAAATSAAATSSPGGRVDRSSASSSGRLPATVTASEAALLAAAGPGCRAAPAAGLTAAATPFAQAADESTVTDAEAERAEEADSSSDGADDDALQPAQPKLDQFSMVIRNCRALGPRMSHSLAAAGGGQPEGVIRELLPQVPPPFLHLLGTVALTLRMFMALERFSWTRLEAPEVLLVCRVWSCSLSSELSMGGGTSCTGPCDARSTPPQFSQRARAA